jgi:hypothetical protein
VLDTDRDETFRARHDLSPRQVERILSGGVIRLMKEKLAGERD